MHVLQSQTDNAGVTITALSEWEGVSEEERRGLSH